ncbi:MAG: sigma-70 family RNA polymerase sigma factor [Myxococcaceae bacterium]
MEGIRSPEEPVRRASWEALAAAYWKPAYKHARLKWRLDPESAADLVQSFFGRAFEKDFFSGFDPARARFRTFLKVCLDRHAANEDKASRRLKRGGDEPVVTIALEAAEAELARPDQQSVSPDDIFDQEWRRSVINAAVASLREACERSDKASCFTLFERYDLCEGERPTYAALGEQLGLPVTTVTNQLAYARRELRNQVVEVLERITASRDELREEAKALLGIELR